jgi:hypothetical protein
LIGELKYEQSLAGSSLMDDYIRKDLLGTARASACRLATPGRLGQISLRSNPDGK